MEEWLMQKINRSKSSSPNNRWHYSISLNRIAVFVLGQTTHPKLAQTQQLPYLPSTRWQSQKQPVYFRSWRFPSSSCSRMGRSASWSPHHRFHVWLNKSCDIKSAHKRWRARFLRITFWPVRRVRSVMKRSKNSCQIVVYTTIWLLLIPIYDAIIRLVMVLLLVLHGTRRCLNARNKSMFAIHWLSQRFESARLLVQWSVQV